MKRLGRRAVFAAVAVAGACIALALLAGPCVPVPIDDDRTSGTDGIVPAGSSGATPPAAPRRARGEETPRVSPDVLVRPGDPSESRAAVPDTLPVRVVLAGTDVPIPNVRVEVRWPGKSPWSRTGPDGVWLAPRPPVVAKVTAGEDAEVDGVWYGTSVVEAPADATDVRIELRRTGFLSGSVVLPDGRSSGRIEIRVVGPDGRPQTTMTAADGSFGFRSAEGVPVTLSLTGAGEEDDAPERHREVVTWFGAVGPISPPAADVVLRAEQDPLDAELDVLVLGPDGAPLAGARVAALVDSASDRAVPQVTGIDGRVRLRRLRRAALRVFSYRFDLRPGAVPEAWIPPEVRDVEARGQELTLRYVQGATLEGRVVDAQGGAVAGARLQLTPNVAPLLTGVSWLTSEDGGFRLVVPAELPTPVQVIATLGARRRASVEVSSPQSGLRIVLPER